MGAGVYRPDRGTRDRSASFGLISGVAIYGGFAGTESDLAERDPAANVTVLSGDLIGNDRPGFVNYADNSVHVVTAFGVEGPAVLDGFTITGGNANIDGGGDSDTRIGGGGLFADESSPVVSGCVFEANSAGRGEPTTGFFGGAVYIRNRVSPIAPRFENCDFTRNRSVSGGALALFSEDLVPFQQASEYDMQVVDCRFIENDADDQTGGAVFTAGSPFNTETTQSLRFERCLFEGNHASYGGAMIVQNPLQFSMVDCDLVANSASVHAGGIWHVQTGGVDVFPARFVGCTFEANTSEGSGGALDVESASAEVARCSFLGNDAVVGAGIFTAGFGSVGCADTITVVDSVFSGNTGLVGSGMDIVCATRVIVANSTFATNTSARGAAGLFINDGNVQVANSVFWGNAAGGRQSEDAQVTHFGAGVVTVDYSLLQGLSGALGGEGNIDADPLFSDVAGPDGLPGTADDDLRLGAGSPAIDAADNLRVPADGADIDGDGDTGEATPLDLAGRARFADDASISDTGVSGNGHEQVADMGASEGAGCVADFDGDGAINTRDVLAFLGAWNTGAPGADFNGDGAINTLDVLAFLGAWDAGC